MTRTVPARGSVNRSADRTAGFGASSPTRSILPTVRTSVATVASTFTSTRCSSRGLPVTERVWLLLTTCPRLRDELPAHSVVSAKPSAVRLLVFGPCWAEKSLIGIIAGSMELPKVTVLVVPL